LLPVDAAHTEKALVVARAFFGYEVSSLRATEAVAFNLLKSGWHHGLQTTPANTRDATQPVQAQRCTNPTRKWLELSRLHACTGRPAQAPLRLSHPHIHPSRGRCSSPNATPFLA